MADFNKHLEKFLNSWVFKLGVFFSILAWVIYSRFNRLTEQGMIGHDVFQYVDFADSLLRGEPKLLYYRPVAYWINAFFLEYFQGADYSTRIGPAIFDVGTVVLLFLFARRLIRNDIIALVSTAFYAFSILSVSRMLDGTVHSYGTFFITLAAYLYVWVVDLYQTNRKAVALLSYGLGLCVGLAANTHEDLILASGGFFFAFLANFLFMRKSSSSGSRETWKRFGILNLLALVGILTPFLVGVAMLGWVQIEGNIREIHRREQGRFPSCTFPVCHLRVLEAFITINFGKVLAVVLAASAFFVPVVFNLKRQLFRHPRFYPALVIVLLPTVYLLLYTHFLNGRAISRVYIPFVPLTYLYLVCALGVFWDVFFRKYRSLFLIAIAAAWAFQSHSWEFVKRKTHDTRLVYNALKDKVTPERRILMPTTFDNRGSINKRTGYGLKSLVYFGDRLTTLVDDIDLKINARGSFRELLKTEKIGYVVVNHGPKHHVSTAFPVGRYFLERYHFDFMDAVGTFFGVDPDRLAGIDRSTLTYGELSKWIDQTCVAEIPPNASDATGVKVGMGRSSCLQTINFLYWRFERDLMLRELQALGARVEFSIPQYLDVYEIP